MLPDIRAVFAAVIAAVALLTISFGLVATFRVAQDSRSGSLQADLAQRGRIFAQAGSESRPMSLIDRPAPLEANPVPTVEIREAPEIIEETPEIPMSVALAEPEAEPAAIELPATELPSADPPMGGPLPEQTVIHPEPPIGKVVDEAKKKAEKAAAKKARAARIARQRKAAARRAAQERAKQLAAQERAKQQSAGSFNSAPFGNSFGNFGNSTSGQ